MHQIKKTLSVVIPSRNSANLLKTYLKHNYQLLNSEALTLGVELELILIYEETGDGSLAIAREAVGDDLIATTAPAGSGYGGKCNLGVSMARGTEILILTTDVEIQSPFLSPMLEAMAHPKTFSVSPKILRPLEGGQNESITYGKFRRHQIEVLRSKKSDSESADRTRNILWPCGAVFLTSKEKFVALGGFASEYLPGYSEDVDLGIRAWRESWGCSYIPTACVLHWHNSTFKLEGTEYLNFLLVRNHIVLNLKFLPWPEKYAFLLKRLFRSFKSMNRSEFKSIIHAIRIWLKMRNKNKHFTFDQTSLIKLLSNSQ